MFLSNLTARFRGEAFDYMVEQTDRALHNPAVVEKLGSFAFELSDIARSLFLPNVRHGEVTIPESQKGTENPAFLPVMGWETSKVGKMIGAALQVPMHKLVITGPIHSETYDITMDAEEMWRYIHAEAQKAKGKTGPAAPKPMGEGVMHHWRHVKNNEFTLGRPIIAVRAGIMLHGANRCAQVGGHELSHAVDWLTEAPLFEHPAYAAATEYRAYHVADAIDNWYKPLEGTRMHHKVEAFRQEHADSTRPFHPTPAMIEQATELGIVNH